MGIPVYERILQLFEAEGVNTLFGIPDPNFVHMFLTAEKRGWEMSKQREKDGDETLAKNGMTVHTPDAKMRAAFQKIGAQMAAEWEKTAGPSGQAILKRYRGGK